MITQIILDKLSQLTSDVSMVGGLAFSVFLVLFLFSKMKTAIDSKIRVKRQVRRLQERDRAHEIYHKTLIRKREGKGLKPSDVDVIYRQEYGNRFKTNYKNNKKTNYSKPSYSSFLKGKTSNLVSIHQKKHSAFKKASNRSRFTNSYSH